MVDDVLVKSARTELMISGAESPRSYKLSQMKGDSNFYRVKTKRLHVEPILASPKKVYGISSQMKIGGGRSVLLPLCCKTSPEL